MPLRICFVASEVTPLAKTGGLADVAGALVKSLHALGHDVRLFMPLYRQVNRRALRLWPVEFLRDVTLRLGNHTLRYSVQTCQLPGSGAMIYLIDAPALFERDALYGNAPDEHLRFLLLTHAALQCCQRMGFAPQVFHCNDWHTGLGPLLLRTMYRWDKLFEHTRSLLSIHNIAYQGPFDARVLPETGLAELTSLLDAGELARGRVNPLREGIRHADHISTVSPTYAREIQTPQYGYGLDGDLRARGDAITGILNGVDYAEWDPRHDRFLPKRYNASRLSVKAELKREFMQRNGLGGAASRERIPLLGMVSRLAAQKGFDLLIDALPLLLQEHEFHCAMLGSGEARYERFFTQLARRYPARVAFRQGYSEEQAHWIEAASDLFLMPSLYEPCGLNQMYSLRYGTIPIVRRTGGLADSVQHFDPVSREGTGVVFNDYDAGGVRWGVGTAIQWYRNKALWRQLMKNAMAQDFSWEHQVEEYVALYERLVEGAGESDR
ncbi:MAG: glycogen synthase [Nevskiaceae bacterium]|jgi:starch synthase|nr:glycogen synthase [Nevskiaceae bacterium]